MILFLHPEKFTSWSLRNHCMFWANPFFLSAWTILRLFVWVSSRNWIFWVCKLYILIVDSISICKLFPRFYSLFWTYIDVSIYSFWLNCSILVLIFHLSLSCLYFKCVLAQFQQLYLRLPNGFALRWIFFWIFFISKFRLFESTFTIFLMFRLYRVYGNPISIYTFYFWTTFALHY